MLPQASPHWCGVFAIVLVVVCLATVRAGLAQAHGCTTDREQIAHTLERIAQSTDPCGESPEIASILERFSRCSQTTYEICLDTTIQRNVFDRPGGPGADLLPRTISWNPALRSQLELGCDGDPSKPVTRDPTASLLHEIVHAVQDCEGLNPGDHELEAVRIENVYRRAAGLCQRTGYGGEPLPAAMVRSCGAGECSCRHPVVESVRASLSTDQGVLANSTALPLESASGDRPR